MEAFDTLLGDLDRLVKGSSAKTRAKTFRKVAALYFASVDSQQDAHVDFFGDVFGLLVDHVDSDQLAVLSRQIAPIAKAPAKLVRRLANDDEIAIAGPVIERSERLTSDDLVMLATTKSQAHLAAIGGRERIDSTVTTVLVERADGEVIKKVARNCGAEFSSDGFARLAQRAFADDELAETVGSRSDIPAGVLQALVSRATQSARARMLAAASEEMKSEIAGVMNRNAGADGDVSTRRQMKELQHAGRLRDSDLMEMAQARRVKETVGSLELLSNMPGDLIREFMTQAAVEAMPVVCRAADLSWPTIEAILSLCRKRGRALDDKDRRQALKTYTKLNKSTAEQLLRFWFVRGSHCTLPSEQDAAGRHPVGPRGRTPRRRVEMAASIMVAGTTIVDATVEDISMEGAKLRLASPCALPDWFVLCLRTDHEVRRYCEVRWRTRDHVGIKFRDG